MARLRRRLGVFSCQNTMTMVWLRHARDSARDERYQRRDNRRSGRGDHPGPRSSDVVIPSGARNPCCPCRAAGLSTGTPRIPRLRTFGAPPGMTVPVVWNQRGAPRINNGGGCSIIAYTARPHHIPQTTTMQPYLELGLDTFGDVTRDADGRPLPQAQVIRHVIDEAVLADEVG